MKAQTPDPMQKAIEAEVIRLNQEDAPLKRAMAETLPGPLADAFALAQDIEVGPYKVRAFVDRDFEFLRILEHPLDKMYKDQMAGAESSSSFMPTGLPMWQAAYMLTKPVREVKAILSKADGVKQFNAEAEDAFADLQGRALHKLFEAIMKQVIISSSTAVAYDNVTEGEEAKAKENPPSDLRQATG